MDDSINGLITLAIGNGVVALLAISIRQQRKSREASIPSLFAGVAALGIHAGVQTLAMVIASSFFESMAALAGFAVLFGLGPTALCLLLIYDWVAFKRMDAEPVEETDTETLDMETARRYVVWGEYDNAKRAYLAYAAAHPESPEPLFGLEGMYVSQGRFSQAAEVCRQIMNTFEHDILTWTKAAERAADLYDSQLKRPRDAQEIRDEIMRRNPAAQTRAKASPDTPVDEATMVERLRIAREHAQRGSRDSALKRLQELRNSNPRDPRPLFEMAVILEADLQTEAALRTLETLVRDYAGNPGVWAEASLKLADLYLHRYGNEDAARALLERIVEKSPLAEDRAAAQARLEQINHPWA